MDDPETPPSPRKGSFVRRLVGAAAALAGLALLLWLGSILYQRSEGARTLLVAIGIPLLLLIAWIGLGLLLPGLASLTKRR